MAAVVQGVQDLIESLSTLGIQPSVAVRLVDLSRDPDADLDDYVELVSLSPTLASKIISLANSSWFSPRQPITSVKRAVGMIGVNQVRALSVSFCLEGLHNALGLEPDDSRAYWQASLCKAAAARRLAALTDEKCGDEAFAIGLLQDMGVGALAAMDGRAYAEGLRDPEFAIDRQLEFESKRFGMNHAEAGGMIADRFGLPPHYHGVIAAHHGPIDEATDADHDAVQLAARAVSWLPHDLRSFKPSDLEQFGTVLRHHYDGQWESSEAFVESVQVDFDAMMAQFGHKPVDAEAMDRICRAASADSAANTASLVGELHTMSEQNQKLSRVFDDVVAQQAAAEYLADHDVLTRLFNRQGFRKRAEHALTAIEGTDKAVGLAFVDVDRFKQTNDRYGHDAGDAVLQSVVATIRSRLRDRDLICRWGGDEVVILFVALEASTLLEVSRRMRQGVAATPLTWQDQHIDLSVTIGLSWGRTTGNGVDLDLLISEADRNLYVGKDHGRACIAINDQIIE